MQYIEFSYLEHSTQCQPGIVSTTLAQTHLLGIEHLSKCIKHSPKDFKFLLNKDGNFLIQFSKYDDILIVAELICKNNSVFFVFSSLFPIFWNQSVKLYSVL